MSTSKQSFFYFFYDINYFFIQIKKLKTKRKLLFKTKLLSPVSTLDDTIVRFVPLFDTKRAVGPSYQLFFDIIIFFFKKEEKKKER
jgi:hypothetical protein